MKCQTCNGSGLVQSWYVEDCPECGGDPLYEAPSEPDFIPFTADMEGRDR